ncbi:MULTISPECIES: ester cyclase [Streptosporangium]|uniref:Ester cyclase n=1 Tax=Streptosporangium brasiliense TaxID=47480 RepID=A0ABT9RE51_9ACTN|nr:ester cyclase [Streptosporangium brasiliense]MDP9867097.1 putative ester cyclase [Streptosporangium brasiliense]
MSVLKRVIAVAATTACLSIGVAAAAQAGVSVSPRPQSAHSDQRWAWSLVDRSHGLVRPEHITVDRSIGTRRARTAVHLAQQLYTFWNTGQAKYLHAAVSPNFRDNTLPEGRPQGPAGPASASKNFRAAVPDLTCELSDLLVTGDKITARLVFRGHFTGTFDGKEGQGQKVEFNAIDIQHVSGDRIVEDWHIEDNQTLMAQLDAPAAR